MAQKRRTFIKGSVLAGCSTLMPGTAFSNTDRKPRSKKVMTVAHITDVHLTAENNAPARFDACIEAIKKHGVDFFLNGGDSIMAVDYGHITRKQAQEMWGLWKDSRVKFSEYEMYSCLGNHDMWWAAPSKDDTMYGKGYAMEQLDMPSSYYSFDRNGWHFVILDSNNEGGAALGDEQMLWLDNDLSNLAKETPVLVMSHYPILSACTHVVGGNHKDSKVISKLFYRHPDKKIHCISGHVHLLDSVMYNNVHYYCNGAMSGFWWGEGDKESAQKYWYHETPPGYAIIDLYSDGNMVNTYFPQNY